MLATFFGGLALLLAATGLYGLMSCAVAQRQRETGIRMALGADSYRIMRTVVVDGLMTTLVGLAAAVVSVRLVKSLLFGVTSHDPATLVAAPLVLIAVAVAACLLPAARAARTDPLDALRGE
jgi:putative ABC transport system permease protein